jgi:hypothetical protein
VIYIDEDRCVLIITCVLLLKLIAVSDDELREPIFQTVIGERVSHIPEEGLGRKGIPMKPDRVLGLSRTAKFRESIEACVVNLVHAPVQGNDMIYPFLILEAKREKDPPGFRAIEAQTAFAIRRFLRIQEDLQTSCQSHLDPLVWFFAYQGDEWRLYAAIVKGGKTVRLSPRSILRIDPNTMNIANLPSLARDY